MAASSNYAGFWKRLGAWFIDAIILYFIYLIFGALAYFNNSPGESADEFFCSLFGVLMVWVYFAVLESSKWQATFGKMALGIRVTDTQGRRMSFARATGRYFGKFISTIILGFGFWMICWTEKKQGLHDQMAHTLVINN